MNKEDEKLVLKLALKEVEEKLSCHIEHVKTGLALKKKINELIKEVRDG